MLLELSPQLRKQHFKVAHIVRQFRTIEPGVSATRAPGANACSSTCRVVWRPRCSRPDTAPTLRVRPGNRPLSSELLPTPEGPQSTDIGAEASCTRKASGPCPIGWTPTEAHTPALQPPFQPIQLLRSSRSHLVSTSSTCKPVCSAVSRNRLTRSGSKAGCSTATATNTQVALATGGRVRKLLRAPRPLPPLGRDPDR